MADRDLAVRVDGLRELRRDLRKQQPDTLKQLRLAVKAAAEIVAVRARARAPQRSGRLAKSIRAGTSGDKGVVRSRLPYAGVHEFGGVIRPKGAPIQIRRSAMVYGALDSERDRVVEALADGIDRAARRNGWH